METKVKVEHTPGPWRATDYVPNKRTNRTQSIIWGQQVSPIATVENGPREANARLIAAAPELLATVNHVLIASEDGGDMNDIDWNLLRAVVAKAEGRQL